MPTPSDQHSPSIADVLARLDSDNPPAFALLHRWNPESRSHGPVEVLLGRVAIVERLADIPLPTGRPAVGAGHDALALVPYRQIRERGFDCHDDGTPLQVLRVEESYRFSRDDVLGAISTAPITLRDAAFDLDDEEYAALVKRIVHDEIGGGEGANFVLRRDFLATLDGYRPGTALHLFRRLLAAEHGAYWTFACYTGPAADGSRGRTLVGASPEVHVRMAGGEVVMNPISGTYRYPASGPDVDGLLRFLVDPKERAELAMVVDEELKMMCLVCDRGGQVTGPSLRVMTHLAHTEFELRGHSTWDARDVLRETMFAATVTGSPLENACRVIRRYEPTGRGYYAAALALFGRDDDGTQCLDSPILIRAADIDGHGHLRVPVGATLVRDSNPDDEVAETWAKAAGVLEAIAAADCIPAHLRRTRRGTPTPALQDDPRVSATLARRRDSLAPFWLQRAPEPAHLPSGQVGIDVVVIDTGDSFTAMLAHLLRSADVRTSVVGYDDPGLLGRLDARPDVVVLGPGPGAPDDTGNPRMATLHALAADLLRRQQDQGVPVLGVCLGHELIAHRLGLRLARLPQPHQGLQRTIDLFGRRATVGFYNSFTAYADDADVARLRGHGIELSRDADTGEVFALRGPAIAGAQFHAESVLTLDGPGILRRILDGLRG